MAPSANTGFLLSLTIMLLLLSALLVEAQNPILKSTTEWNDDILNQGLQDFSINLFTHIVTEHGRNKNICVSPISIWTMLSVLLEGSDGATQNQLRKVLNYDTFKESSSVNDAKGIRRRFRTIKTALNITSPTINIECVDAIFVNNKQNTLRGEYKELILREYRSELHSLDFDNPIAARLINGYVKKITTDKITEIVDQSDLSGTNMVMLSAAFFEGQWQNPFNKADTKRENFFNEQGQVMGTVEMMNQKLPLPYASMESLQAHVVKLPYGDGTKLFMLVIVPRIAIPLSTVFAKLQNVSLTEIDAQLEKSIKMYPYDDVEVSIPRFSVKTNVYLKEILQSMGLVDAFDPSNANFSKMFGDYRGYISKIIHKSIIEVNEEGTVASGAVYLDLINKSPELGIKANKPFIYLIVEKTTCNIVFAANFNKAVGCQYVNKELAKSQCSFGCN